MLSLSLAQAPAAAARHSSLSSDRSSPAPHSSRPSLPSLKASGVSEARKYFRSALDLYHNLDQTSDSPGIMYVEGMLSVVSMPLALFTIYLSFL